MNDSEFARRVAKYGTPAASIFLKKKLKKIKKNKKKR